MTWYHKILGITEKQETKDVPQGVAFSDTESRGAISKAYYPGFLVKPPFGWPKFKDIYTIRRVATAPQPAMAIQTIIDEVVSTARDIVPKEGFTEDDQIVQAHIDEVKTFFDNPNSNKESFGHILRIVVREILELDSGVIVKEFNSKEQMVEIRATDSAGFLKNPNLFGKFEDRDDLILESFVNIDLRVDGAVSETQLRLPLSGAGQIGTTEFFEDDAITLPKTPETVELLLDASNPPTTIREGGSQDGSTGNYYFVDRENRKVKPVEGSTFPSGQYATVNYTWLAPSPIHMANQDSKDNFGIFEKQVTLTDIVTVADAEARAVEILNRFSNPFTLGDLMIKSDPSFDIRIGDTVVIVDSVNSPNIDGEFVITKQTLKYPGENQEITVGDKELRLADWQMNVEERLKRLEEQFLKNQDLILELFNFQNQFTSVPRYRKVQIANIAGDTLIWGSPSFGIWGQFNWGSQTTFGFVLGHASAGVLGTSKLGSNTSVPVNHFVQQYQNIFTENFIDEDFKDAVNTTSTWTTTGSVTFTSGQVAQSSSVDFNNGIITKTKLTSTEISGSFNYELSANGGINWESVANGILYNFINTGKDLRFRITENAAGSGEISKVVITNYH